MTCQFLIFIHLLIHFSCCYYFSINSDICLLIDFEQKAFIDHPVHRPLIHSYISHLFVVESCWDCLIFLMVSFLS